MGILDFFVKQKPARCGDPEWNGIAFDIEDARIPAPIRAAVQSDYRIGYRRGDLIEKRTLLMQAWSDYCAKIPTAAKVTPIRGTAAA